MAASKRMRASQGHNLLIVESHAVKDVPQVLSRRILVVASISVRQETIRQGVVALVVILASRTPLGHLGAAHFFNRDSSSQRPQVTVGDARELRLDGLEPSPSLIKAGVGAPSTFLLEAHHGTFTASEAGFLVVGSCIVPCETHKGRTVASVVVALVLKQVPNRLLDSLVVDGLLCQRLRVRVWHTSSLCDTTSSLNLSLRGSFCSNLGGLFGVSLVLLNLLFEAVTELLDLLLELANVQVRVVNLGGGRGSTSIVHASEAHEVIAEVVRATAEDGKGEQLATTATTGRRTFRRRRGRRRSCLGCRLLGRNGAQTTTRG
mmetsp:Transcript_22037/g.43326  ORF Transcript_22037/g.43326 Transcript_22037/m.43326 type:complete len:319 (+) Transcript_22037:880-1836(+)